MEIRKLTVLLLLLITGITGNAQNSNFRAQGNYYSAKTNFESGNYLVALDYINKSKIALAGTNYQLQYLHIITAYRLDRFDEAAKELQTYFDMEENKTKPVSFNKSVDKLTDDETKELSKLIDPIFELAEKKKNNPCHVCSGTGKVIKSYNCDKCNGSGHIMVDCSSNTKGWYCQNGKVNCKCTSCDRWGTVCDNGVHTHYGIVQIWVYCIHCENGKLRCDNCQGAGQFKKDCIPCNHTGKLQYSEKKTCDNCYGRGFIK
jgi:hypothetical protein